MDDFSMGVLTNYAASASTSIAKQVIKRFFPTSPKINLKNAGQVSAGLAIGYYFNFVKPIADELEKGSLALKIESKKNPRSFESNDVKIKIILPQKLEGAVFNRCSKELQKSSIATLNLKNQLRPYPVRCDLVCKTKKKKELIIVDYAGPAAVIKFYYEEVLKVNTSDQKNWDRAQKIEIETFQKTIQEMINKGFHSLANKVSFSFIQ
jgi:hypothetical protein